MRERRFDEIHDKPPGLRERIADAWNAARELVATRREIFSEELSEQLRLIARGAIGFAIAAALAGIAILLLTALVATLFALLFGSAWAGILATLVLFLLGIGAAALFAVKSFEKVTFDFPATKEGLAEDVSAIRSALAPREGVEPGETDPADVEQRFRAGSE